jgi:hypothetical protein
MPSSEIRGDFVCDPHRGENLQRFQSGFFHLSHQKLRRREFGEL